MSKSKVIPAKNKNHLGEYYYNGKYYPTYQAAMKAYNSDTMAESMLSGVGTGENKRGSLRSLWNKWTGAGLTNAEVEENQYNAMQAEADRQFQSDEAELAWQRSELSAENAYARQRELRQTAAQDTVMDYQAAGLNPAIMYGSSGVNPTSSAPQGSSPAAAGASAGAGLPGSGGLADLLNLFRIRSEIKVNQSIAEKNRADANLSEKSADLTAKQSDWYERVTSQSIAEARSRIVSNIETAASESEKRSLMQSERMLNNANADQIAALMPYYQRELDARSSQERASARASLVSAAYQQGLIDEGMISSAVRETNSRASVNEVEHSLKSFEDDVVHNRTTPLTEGDAFTGLGNALYKVLSNPLGLILGGLKK